MARKLSPSVRPSVRPSVGSLFSGIGGFDLGFEWAGFEIAWQCEADEFCRRVLRKHWPDTICYPDITTLRMADAPKDRNRDGQKRARRSRANECGRAIRVDVLIGGFPCQDVSVAGRGVGLEGARSGLWFEYLRCVREFRPRVVVIENVRGLLVRGIDAVLWGLSDAGYESEWAIVRAADVGAPHRRERVFIVAYTSEGRQRESNVARHADRCGARLVDATESRSQRDLAEGGEGFVHRRIARPVSWPSRPGEAQHDWEPPRVIASARTQSRLGDGANGISRGMAGWRRAALGALGNAVVPEVAEVVAWRVREIMEASE